MREGANKLKNATNDEETLAALQELLKLADELDGSVKISISSFFMLELDIPKESLICLPNCMFRRNLRIC